MSAHGKSISGPGVKSLIIVCCVCMGRMFDETCRLSWKLNVCRGSELEVVLCSLEPTLSGGMVFGP